MMSWLQHGASQSARHGPDSQGRPREQRRGFVIALPSGWRLAVCPPHSCCPQASSAVQVSHPGFISCVGLHASTGGGSCDDRLLLLTCARRSTTCDSSVCVRRVRACSRKQVCLVSSKMPVRQTLSEQTIKPVPSAVAAPRWAGWGWCCPHGTCDAGVMEGERTANGHADAHDALHLRQCRLVALNRTQLSIGSIIRLIAAHVLVGRVEQDAAVHRLNHQADGCACAATTCQCQGADIEVKLVRVDSLASVCQTMTAPRRCSLGPIP